ncbi:MAG: hypothetical protein ACTMIY_11995 [Microbacterium gubbeenense]
MSSTNRMPYLVTETTSAGAPRLAGKRRTTDDIDEAAEIADAIHGQVFAIEPVEPNHVAPKPAITHVSLAATPSPAALPAPVVP